MAAALCTQCTPEREFKSAGALDMHTRMTHGEGLDPGTCPECGKVCKNLGAHRRVHNKPAPADNETSPLFDAATGDEPPAERIPGTEPPASSGKPKLRDRIESRLWRNGGDRAEGGAAAPRTREKRPKAAKRGRHSAAGALGTGWGLLGTALERSGADVPVGRVLQFQGPMAGPILDKLIAGSWFDRIIQPLASKTDDMEDFGTLVGLPIMVALYERAPAEVAAQIQPMMIATVVASLGALAPVLEKREAEQAKIEAVARRLAADGKLPIAEGADPSAAVADSILAAIFAPPPNMPPPATPQPPVTEPAGNGHIGAEAH